MNRFSSFVMVATVALFPAASGIAPPEPNRRNTSVIMKASDYERPSLRPTRDDTPRPTSNRRQPPTTVSACELSDDLGFRCTAAGTPGAEPEDEAELTEGDILTAVREIGLPRLAVTIQPGDSTLVNARTNFYTDPQAFARSITLLDFDIDLAASPIRYTWVHGDATSRATTSPGRPYPNLDVTHRYRKPAEVVRPRVDVTYRVRYRVDGGAWATIGQTLTATGPTADLEVNEAAPVLTAPRS